MPKKGKKGTEQRVKGNVQSASSGRMSELLGREATVGFIGFDSVSSGLPGNHPVTDEIDGGARGSERIDDVIVGSGVGFQVVMKQLGKRDATTKLKALQEFSVLCGQETSHEVVAVLNVWSLMYNKLSMDNDNRVREASHKALLSCAETVKSNLAPHLKSIIGSWVSGMCDPHGPASSAAKLAFDGAFPSKKQRGVMEFGFKAVFKHSEEMILRETPDTFSDPKVVPADERLQRYERALVMAVHSLSFILRQLSVEFLDKSLEVYESLLVEKRVWKLARHQNPYVRSSMFTLVTAMCEKIPMFVHSHMKLLCSAVLGSLAEDDPVVIGPLWEACLVLVTKTENWNEHVNVQKALLPGLWSFLKSGGYGSAKITYPCLLPLLSILVNKVFSDDPDFARLFLDRLGSGLQADRVRTSRTESEVVCRTYSECFLYLVFNMKPLEEEENLSVLFKLLKELLVFSLIKQCTSFQSDVIFGAVVKVTTSLLQTRDKNRSLSVCLEQFQSDLTASLLSHLDESKPNISRLEGLLSNFHTPPKLKKAKGSSVRFSDEKLPTDEDIDGNDVIEDHVIPSVSSEILVTQRGFVQPAVCSICAKCIATISSDMDENYSALVVTLIRLYCADSSFSSALLSALKSSCPGLLSEHLEEGGSPDSVAITTLLSTLARLDGLSEKRSKFTADLIECVVVLVVRCGSHDDVDSTRDSSSVWQFLVDLVQKYVAVLPLVLEKLGDLGESDKVTSLLACCEHLLTESMVTGTQEDNNVYLWSFLSALFSAQPGSVFVDMAITASMFSLVCEQLCATIRDSSLEISDYRVNLLRVVSKVQSSIAQNQPETCTKLLECLLRWALFNLNTKGDSDLALLKNVIHCYHHLLSNLEDTKTYLQRCSSLVTVEVGKNEKEMTHEKLLVRHLQSAMVYSTLHCHVMSHDTVYSELYAPLTKLPKRVETSLLPLSSLESFCQGELLFSPLFTNLDSSAVADTLPNILTSLIYPAVLLGEVDLLEGVTGVGSELETLSNLQHRLNEIVDERENNLEVIFGEFDKCGDDVVKVWMNDVVSLSLAVGCLGDSQLKENTSVLESRLCSILSTAVDRCLQYGGEHSPQWLGQLVQQLTERVSIEGPLWLPVLHNIFVAMERLPDINLKIIWKDVTSSLYIDPEGPIIYSALKSIKTSLFEQQIEEIATQRQSDPCLVVGCLRLLPENELLLSLGSKVICELSDKQSNSELSLFENLSDSEGDPLSYSTLSLFLSLLKQQRVPAQVWDFVLCSMVSLVELISECDTNSSVNRTVFSCLVMETLYQISLHFNSPLASSDQSKEWEEFFLPALQKQLLPFYIKHSAHSDFSTNPCLTYQTFHLSKAVSVLCTQTEGVDLVKLVDIILLESSTYPQQVTAFKLAERLLESQTIVLESEDEQVDTAVNLSYLKGLFSKSFERMDMDQVFFEDSHSGPNLDESSKVTSRHTSAYLLTWLLIIRTMSQCDPESRGVLTEWLKEVSLFGHLLNGLFKFLSNSKRKTSEPTLQVSLKPKFEQLAHVTYGAVARQLPCMLRQWYLTLNRQTSSQVSWFTTKYISPALQKSELQCIHKSSTSHGNMDVRVYSGVSEVSVVYHVDEFSIELFVRLPETYPLQPPVIREGKRVRVEQAQWRKWLLQLNIFVTNQNGSLLDGLLLWKSNLDKHFSGVEDCMICFSVIHSSNYSLPKMNCRTCKKRFHSACLYKWFNTSNKSSCPLCRNIF